MQKNKGITLIALVITIIILLIIAGVTIGQLTVNGLFDKVKLAKEKFKNSQEKEEIEINKYINELDSYVEANRNVDLRDLTPGTATSSDILEGKIAWVNGQKITGTLNKDDYVIPKWEVNSSGNAIAYGFLTLPDLTQYNILKIDSVTLSGGYVMQVALIDENGDTLQNISISNQQQTFNISNYSGNSFRIIAYANGMPHWGIITFNNITLSK